MVHLRQAVYLAMVQDIFKELLVLLPAILINVFSNINFFKIIIFDNYNYKK